MHLILLHKKIIVIKSELLFILLYIFIHRRKQNNSLVKFAAEKIENTHSTIMQCSANRWATT